MAYWPSVPPCYFPCCTEGEGFFKKVAFFSLFSAHGGHSFLYGFRYPLPTLPRVSSIADRIRTYGTVRNGDCVSLGSVGRLGTGMGGTLRPPLYWLTCPGGGWAASEQVKRKGRACNRVL